MRRLRSFMSNVVVIIRSVACSPASIRRAGRSRKISTDGGEVPFSAQDVLDRALLADREDDDRHTVFLGKRERRRIHDLQAPVQRLLMVEAVVSGRLRVL